MRIAFVLLPLVTFNCAEIAGITDLPDAASTFDAPFYDGPPIKTTCTNGPTVLTTGFDSTNVAASGGHDYAKTLEGLIACNVSTPCNNPGLLFNLSASDKLFAYVAGSQLAYTLQSGANAGSVHTRALDGTNDQTLGQGLAYPSWIAVSGSRTFWVDDASTVTSSQTPAVLHCIGCGGSDMQWITGLNATHAAFADANDVYVLADDGTSSFTYGIYGCSVSTACGGSPRVVAKGLETDDLGVASDGTNVFVVRSDQQDIVAIDKVGTAKPLAQNVDIVAIAVDAARGQLFFVTYGGLVAVVKTDGSSPPSVVSNCDTNYGDIDSLAIDATNVYVMMTTLTPSGATILAIPRP